MIKRLMVWLLRQFQKIAEVLSGRRRMRSPNTTQQITPVTDSSEPGQENAIPSDISLNNININSVAPVAQRVSLSTIPAQELEALEQQAETLKDINKSATDPPAGSSQDLVEDADIHRKLDATAAAISGEEFVNPTTQAAVSELLPSDLDTHTPVGDAAWSPLSVETSDDDQPPSIHDLLPAIEPEEDSVGLDSPAAIFSFDIYESEVDEVGDAKERDEIKESAEVELEGGDVEESLEAETSVLSVSYEEVDELAPLSEVKESLSTTSRAHFDEEQIDLVPESEEQAGEEQINKEQASEEQFSQSQHAQAQTVGEYSDVEQLSEVVSRERAPTLKDSFISAPDSVLTAPVIEESVLEEIDPNKSDLEEPVLEEPNIDKSEPVNPWLTAIPAARQEPNQTNSEELESKSGTVKLLFTIKPGNYHGYIAPDDGSKDILFHQRYINADIFDKIERGSSVIATVKVMAGKAYATHVDLL